jgi:hypothetical protein
MPDQRARHPGLASRTDPGRAPHNRGVSVPDTGIPNVTLLSVIKPCWRGPMMRITGMGINYGEPMEGIEIPDQYGVTVDDGHGQLLQFRFDTQDTPMLREPGEALRAAVEQAVRDRMKELIE